MSSGCDCRCHFDNGDGGIYTYQCDCDCNSSDLGGMLVGVDAGQIAKDLVVRGESDPSNYLKLSLAGATGDELDRARSEFLQQSGQDELDKWDTFLSSDVGKATRQAYPIELASSQSGGGYYYLYKKYKMKCKNLR